MKTRYDEKRVLLLPDINTWLHHLQDILQTFTGVILLLTSDQQKAVFNRKFAIDI